MKYIYLAIFSIVISTIYWYFMRNGEHFGLGILVFLFGLLIINPISDDSYKSGDENSSF